MFKPVSLISFFALLLLASPHFTLAQAPAQKDTGQVTGRVTSGDKPLPQIAVGAYIYGSSSGVKLIARSMTDHDGRYSLNGLQPGNIGVMPLTPAYVSPETDSRNRPI
jgi:hypothetical protein